MRTLRQIGWIVWFSTMAYGADNRITRAIDSSRLTILKRHLPPEAQPQFDRGPLARSTILHYASLRLKPAAGLEQFLIDQATPSSSDYQRWLTPEQFGDRFGLSTDDLAALVSWLKSEGMQVHDIARGRTWITFSGTVEQVDRAFHTAIHRYVANGQSHFANATDLSIPAAFGDVVSGVEGLDDFALQPLYQVERPPAGILAPQFTSGSSRYLAPDDFATIYNVTPLYQAGIAGAGQKIAIIGRSDIDLTDVRQFRQNFGLPASDPQLVLVGPDPGFNSGIIESNLDLQWAGAVARQATIVYVYASSVTTAVQYAVDQNLAPLISFSYGGCEAYNSVGLRAVAQQANAQGITWVAASGDWGAGTCDLSAPTPQVSKGPSASFPAAIPEITGVGGTEFNDGTGESFWASINSPTGSSALAYVPEAVWNTSAIRNDLSASGGGPSILFTKPPWQSGPGVPNDNARDTPDVALASSPQHYAYIVYVGGVPIHVGGTSAGSPAFAGILALLSQYLTTHGSQSQPGLGNVNPTLYRLARSTPDAFHDITAGDNRLPCEQGSPGCTEAGMGYAAGPGYDLATGLGSIDAYHLVTEWKTGSATTTLLSIAPATFALADTVQLTASISSKTGVPTGAVTFMTNDTNVGVAPLLPSGTASVTVSASALAVGNGTVTAVYSGDAAYAGSAGTTNFTLELPNSGPLLVPFVSPNPVPQAGAYWPYTVGLSEKAGVGATLTSFVIDGIQQNLSLWSTTTIAPKATISAALAASGLSAPVQRQFSFKGQDANGQPWTAQLTVPFVPNAGPAIAPAMTLTSAPSTVAQNLAADSSCQWAQQLTIQETGGFLIQLIGLTAGAADLTSHIQQLFGTTRLAPYGMLQANLCWNSATTPGALQFQLTGMSELGTAVTASLSATLAPPMAAPLSFSVSPQAVEIPFDGFGHPAAVPVTFKFNGNAPDWTATVLPANRTTSWLQVTHGDSGRATLLASAVGLANGVYRAMVSFEAQNSSPSAISIPVTMVVGASMGMAISGVTSVATGKSGFAPGMPVAVDGTGLAPSTQRDNRIPVPFSLAGVSATVNGISAPIYAVSSGEIEIQIPYETGLGSAVLAVNNNGQVASYSFPVAVTAPGIYNFFIDNTAGLTNSARPGDIMTMFFSGAGDLTPSTATGATPTSFSGVAGLPRPRLPVNVTVGGEPANIEFAGNATGLVGVIQINFTVPADLAPGPQPVIVTVGDVSSDPVMLPVSAAPVSTGTSE